MKYGVREICDVTFRAKAPMRLGNRTFFKDEPVLLFDTLTTSSLEGAVTTVYAQGGRGNSRLMAWDGERTVTFNMEDALISPEGLSILAGAELIDATDKKTIKVHKTYSNDEKITITNGANDSKVVTFTVPAKIYGAEKSTESKEDLVYVFPKNSNGDIYTEPYIPTKYEYIYKVTNMTDSEGHVVSEATATEIKAYNENHQSSQATAGEVVGTKVTLDGGDASKPYSDKTLAAFKDFVYVDFYEEYTSNAMQINITADQFGSNFYIEASTLFKDEKGTDHAAEFIIPNGKVQSNFTFSLAASGDPSTFAFTVDAFPDYTRFDKSKKVLSAIQVLGATIGDEKEFTREATVTAWTDLSKDAPVVGDINTDPEGDPLG